MDDKLTELLNPGGDPYSLPEGESARQAIAPLRGYAYQLHRSLTAWMDLPDTGSLYLEAAEDYATLLRDPTRLEEVLTATQLKDTRESGSVTLNSPDALDAVRHLWAYQEANPGRRVRLVFMTTSPIGRERNPPVANGQNALELWGEAAQGADATVIRAALASRFPDGALGDFMRSSSDPELRNRLLKNLIWSCGEASVQDVADDNRSGIIELGATMGGAPDLSSRAADVLLVRVLETILKSPTRRLTRGELLTNVQELISIRVPSQVAVNAMTGLAQRGPTAIELAQAGIWRDVVSGAAAGTTNRPDRVAELRSNTERHGGLWLHGATGLGKTTLAELLAIHVGGTWRLLDLRGVSDSVAVERLTAARGIAVATPNFAGVIVDDITPDQEHALEMPLTLLAGSLRRRGAILLITSHNVPGRRLERAAGLSVADIIVAPPFDETEVGLLVAAHGGNAATWSRFVWIAGGFGHPQLVDALISGLAARGWPNDEMSRWINAGLKSEDVEAERDSIRLRLLQELPPEAYELLARATRIVGTFDRELVLAAAEVEPALASASVALDRLSGHWIERRGRKRMQASQLVAGLDRQVLDVASLRRIDEQIALSILGRRKCDADLLDTAFAHAVLAEASELLLRVVQLVMTIDPKKRPGLAAAMPMLRTAERFGRSIDDDPQLALTMRMAQHHLVTPSGDTARIDTSTAAILAELDALPAGENHARFETMALSVVLLDQFTFGKLPGWFDLLTRFETALQRRGPNEDVGLGFQLGGEDDPVEFAVLAHAGHPRGLADLEAFFDNLAQANPELRSRRLKVLTADRGWLSLAIDGAWLQESNTRNLGGHAEAELYQRLGDMALTWGETQVAARCFKAVSIMLDEYANAPEAALAALDQADQKLPDDLDLRRGRLKILWRAKKYAEVLVQTEAIADRLEAEDPLDAAFALREAAIAAAELGNWAQAGELFSRGGHAAAALTAHANSALSVGMMADAAACRFESGDAIGAVDEMRRVLDRLAALDPTNGVTAHACHIVSRHILLWMQSAPDGGRTAEGEEVRYSPGAASNPSPHPGLSERPITPLAAVWWMLARLALREGVPLAKVLSWPNVAVLMDKAPLGITMRMSVFEALLRDGSIDGFKTHVVALAEALTHVDLSDWQNNPPDPLAEIGPTITKLSALDLQKDPARGHLRDALFAMGAAVFLPGQADVTVFEALRSSAIEAAGFDPAPEWTPGGQAEPSTIQEAAGQQLRLLALGEPASVGQMLVAHLRLFEWVRQTNHRVALWPVLAARIARDWLSVLDTRASFLRSPMRYGPPLRAAAEKGGSDEQFAATVLLAAVDAVNLNVPAEMIDGLRASANH